MTSTVSEASRDRAPGLYLHVPFCSEICPYCDFAVLEAGDERRRSFVGKLVREAGLLAAAGSPAAELTGFDTVYLGGGTPSILSEEELGRILAEVGERLGVAADAWISLEANPEDVTAERLRAWRGLGVRSLSLGVQSFDDEELSFLGRRHSAAQAVRSIELALGAAFHTVSIDLIYALPGQSRSALTRSLEWAVRLGPQHLSCYELTVHQGTPFGRLRQRGELVEAGRQRRGELFGLTHRYLAEAGWPGYEVSSFACSPEHRSRHTRKYWDHTPYLGLGPSAHSFDGKRRRWWNERRLSDYERRLSTGEPPVAGQEQLKPADLRLEATMLGLRTTEGIDRARFERRFGADPGATPTALRLAERGMIRLTSRRLAPTLDGLSVADSLAIELDGALGRLPETG